MRYLFPISILFVILLTGCVAIPGQTGGPECYTDEDCSDYGIEFICSANGDCEECPPKTPCAAPPTGCWYEKDESARCPSCGEIKCNPTIPPPNPIIIPTNNEVYITSPSNGEKFIVDRPVYLRADKLGSKIISRVEFWKGHHELLDGVKKTDKTKPDGVAYFGLDTSEPYEKTVNSLPVGTHDITFKIITQSGEEIMKSTSLEVIKEPSNPSYCIKNGKDECEELFFYSDKEYSRTFKYYCYDPDNDGISWDGVGWGEGYRLQGLAGAYEAFHDKKYLELMVRDMNAMFCIDEGISENDCVLNGKNECGYTYQGWGKNPEQTQKEWGWYGDSYGSSGVYFDCFVCEGIMMQGMTRFVEFVKLNPKLENEKYGTYTYKQLADKYLKEIEYLYDKWDRRGLFKEVGDGSGAYVYYDDPNVQNSHPRMNLPHNQQVEWAVAMITLYRITEDVKYRDRAAKVLYHLKKNYYTEQDELNWNYWDHSGVWDYTMDEGQEKYGGLEHWEGEEHKMGYKRISSSAMVEGWRNCIVFDDEDLQGAMQRNHMFGKIPRDDYDTLMVPLFGYYDKTHLESVFDILSKVDDSPNKWDYAPTSRFRLVSGQFWDALKDPSEKYYVCNLKEIPIYQTFDGATTNFKNVEDITNVKNVVLEKENFGKIEFGDVSLDMANLFLDAYVQIGQDFIFIDGEELPELDIPATVTLYDVNIDRPTILKDNNRCYPDCTKISTGKDIKFKITGAGRYHIDPQKKLLYKDNFETGDFSKWHDVDKYKDLSVTSSKSRTGNHAMEIKFGEELEMYADTPDFNVKDYVYKISFMISDDFVFKTEKYDRSFNLGTNPSSEFGKNIIMIDYARGAEIAEEAWNYETRVYMQYTDNNGWEHWVPQNRFKAPKVEKGKWYDLEYHFISGPSGYVDLYLNGDFVGRSTVGDTSKSMQESFRVGVMREEGFSGSFRGAVYLDDFEAYGIIK